MTNPADHKRALRVALRARRAGIDAATAVAAAQAVCALLRGVAAPGDVLAGYWPMGDELDIRDALIAFAREGGRCALPQVVARGRPLLFRAWSPGDALVPGGFGTSIPAPERAEITPTLLLVPLLGFDRRGYRLGYGGGYYDMTIAALRRVGPLRAIGVGFAQQEVETLPVEPFDQRLDAIATEAGLVGFTRAAS